MKFTRSLLFVAATVFVACDHPTAPSFATAVAEVIEVSPASPGVNVKTKVTVANATSRTLYLNFCASTLERKSGSDPDFAWESVAGILCVAIGYENPFHGMMPIAPGEYREVTLHLYIPRPLPDLDDANRFRMNVQVVAELPSTWWGVAPVVQLSTGAVFSNEFRLTVP